MESLILFDDFMQVNSHTQKKRIMSTVRQRHDIVTFCLREA